MLGPSRERETSGLSLLSSKHSRGLSGEEACHCPTQHQHQPLPWSLCPGPDLPRIPVPSSDAQQPNPPERSDWNLGSGVPDSCGLVASILRAGSVSSAALTCGCLGSGAHVPGCQGLRKRWSQSCSSFLPRPLGSLLPASLPCPLCGHPSSLLLAWDLPCKVPV